MLLCQEPHKTEVGKATLKSRFAAAAGMEVVTSIDNKNNSFIK